MTMRTIDLTQLGFRDLAYLFQLALALENNETITHQSMRERLNAYGHDAGWFADGRMVEWSEDVQNLRSIKKLENMGLLKRTRRLGGVRYRVTAAGERVVVRLKRVDWRAWEALGSDGV